MKDFIKYTLATITGIIVSSMVLFFIGMVLFASIIAAKSDAGETIIQDKSILTLHFKGSLEERKIENPLESILGDNSQTTYGLEDLLKAIKKAKENDKVKGIYINYEMLTGSFASLEELRNALVDFKSDGKFIVSYADTYSQGGYYLSSISDKILLNPIGSIEWNGLSATPIFFKGLLDKLGVEAQIFKVGTYKSAVEPYILNEMSEANREQTQHFLSSLWSNMLKGVSESRAIPVDSLNRLADKLLLFYPAEESIKAGLADSLIYKSEVKDFLKAQLGLDKDDDLNTISLKTMQNAAQAKPKNKSGNILAVYYAYGGIDMGGRSNPLSPENGINSQKVIKDLKKLEENKDVKAVVLRINSPGGSAFGSEQIWKAIMDLKETKPVVVSMGDYAASGGYYISAAADRIVAQPTTLTGSIGIYGMWFKNKSLLSKIGINFDGVKTNAHSDLGVPNKALSAEETAIIQMNVNRGYDLFLTRCANGRGLTKEEVGKVAEGRVWTGETAKELGLVDELGGLDRAIELAKELAEIEEYSLISYPKKKDFLAKLLETDIEDYLSEKIFARKIGSFYNEYKLLNDLLDSDVLQMRMPYYLDFK